MIKQASTLLLSLLSNAYGAGFQLAERSASGLGRAYSGEAAIGDDASILGSNPAGMSLLDDWSYSIGANYITPHIDAEGTGVTGPISSNNVISDGIIPYFYAAKKYDERLSFGLGIYTTYGLKSDYSRDFATGAVTDYSEVLSFNINPVVSYRLNDQWTIGAGFDALYTDGQITSRQPRIGGNLFDLEGDDWGFGYNVGVLFELNERTRFGLHYRSAIELNLEGSAEVGAGFNGFPAGNYDATLDVELPDTIEFSAYHEINDQWAIHADVFWTNWSKFKSLEPKVNPLLDPALAKEENWEDAFRFSVGATYRHNDRLTIRAGVAYDESPVSDSNRTLRIPDADRIWASIGASYVISDRYTLDVGYTHIFADDADLLPEAAGGNSDAFAGTVEGSVDVFAIGLSGSF